MSGTSIRAVLNGGFINQLGALGTGVTRASEARDSLTLPNSSVQVNLGDSLRIGAQSFTKAVENLNLAASFVNLSESALLQLQEVTEDLISVAEEATRVGIGSQRRQRLDTKFRELATDFQELVDGASIGSTDYLSVSSLTDTFSQLGLSKERSQGIAQLLSSFITPTTDESLASEESLATSPVQVSREAYGGTIRYENLGTSTYLGSVSLTANSGGLSEVGGIVSNNSDTVSARVEAGFTSTILPGVSAKVTLLAVNEEEGTAIIASSDDLANTGTSFNQAYLIDNKGNVLQQITNFTDARTILDASVSSDSELSVISSYALATGLDYELYDYSSSGLTGDPNDATVTALANYASLGLASSIKINNEGTLVAYTNLSSEIHIYDVGTTVTTDYNAVPDGSDLTFDFYTETDLVLFAATDAPSDTTEVFILETVGSTITQYGETNAIRVNDVDGSIEKGFFSVVQNTDSIAIHDYTSGDVVVGTLGSSGSYADFSERSISYTLGAGLEVSRVSGASANGVSGEEIDIGISLDGELFRLDADASNSEFTSTNVSSGYGDSLTSEAYITEIGEFYTGRHPYNNFQTGLIPTVFARSTDGYTYEQSGVDYEILSVNEVSGFSIALSSDDPLGYNPSKVDNLFILDPLGRAVSQVTNNSSGTTSYTSADLSDDGLKVAYAKAAGTGNSTDYVSLSVQGADPSSLVSLTVFNARSTEVKISSDGTYVAHLYRGLLTVGSSAGIGSFSLQIGGNTPFDYSEFDFLGNTTLAYVSDQSTLVQTIDAVTEETNTLFSSLNDVDGFSAYQQENGDYAFTIYDAGTNTIKAYNSSSSQAVPFSYSLSDPSYSVSQVSAVVRDGELVVGALGQLSAGLSGDVLHEIETQTVVDTSTLLSQGDLWMCHPSFPRSAHSREGPMPTELSPTWKSLKVRSKQTSRSWMMLKR